MSGTPRSRLHDEAPSLASRMVESDLGSAIRAANAAAQLALEAGGLQEVWSRAIQASSSYASRRVLRMRADAYDEVWLGQDTQEPIDGDRVVAFLKARALTSVLDASTAAGVDACLDAVYEAITATDDLDLVEGVV